MLRRRIAPPTITRGEGPRRELQRAISPKRGKLRLGLGMTLGSLLSARREERLDGMIPDIVRLDYGPVVHQTQQLLLAGELSAKRQEQLGPPRIDEARLDLGEIGLRGRGRCHARERYDYGREMGKLLRQREGEE